MFKSAAVLTSQCRIEGIDVPTQSRAMTYINPATRTVIVLLSAQPHPTQGAVVDEERFFDAIVAALRSSR